MLEMLVRTAEALRHTVDAEHVMKARRHTCDRDDEVSRASSLSALKNSWCDLTLQLG